MKKTKKKRKWTTLQHNGILFPPDFETKNIRIKINNNDFTMNLLQEEMIYQWAKKKETPYVLDKVFQKNFVKDFNKILPSNLKNISYSAIDFSHAHKIVDQEKDARDLLTKEQRKELALQRKKIREEMKEKYGTAIIDGKPTDVANYMAEPPGIFIGRGQHPLRGRWKYKITQKDITLNLDKKASIPKGNWKTIVSNYTATWLAFWFDPLTKSHKYIWLSDTADLKQDNDKIKYDKAVNLSNSICMIKDIMIKDMNSSDKNKRTIATVCYLIYRTAMRVGDEKDPDEADTVGATTLRAEHIKLTDNTIVFDFLGKDSIRWKETITVKEFDRKFHQNLSEIIEIKKPKEEIFGKITSRQVNQYFSQILKGLSAKVFRTYLASKVVTESLLKNDNMDKDTLAKKLYIAKLANLQAAIMCNHKRTVPKTLQKSLQKKKEALKKIKDSKTWEQAELSLQKAKKINPKSSKQKTIRLSRIRKAKETIKQRKIKYNQRLEKAELQIKLVEKTKDYNIGTSLRNYIDPRIFKSWSIKTGLEWEKLYTSALQKKFLWVASEKDKWEKISKFYKTDTA